MKSWLRHDEILAICSANLCSDEIFSLREPPKLGKLASGNPYYGFR